jgi:hypothetical protein
MPTPYTLPVIKLLFATARTCAYPGCQVPPVFEDKDRGIRSVAVQIAHIRSAKTTGPRYDPDYPADKLNTEENLLLLCNKHHPVDRNESEYTIEELLEWKKAQVTGSGGFFVGDEDITGLAAALQASIDELVQATQLQMVARLVGGRVSLGVPEVARVNLDGLDEVGHTMGRWRAPGLPLHPVWLVSQPAVEVQRQRHAPTVPSTPAPTPGNTPAGVKETTVVRLLGRRRPAASRQRARSPAGMLTPNRWNRSAKNAWSRLRACFRSWSSVAPKRKTS